MKILRENSTSDVYSKLKQFATSDYQNRRGDYPRSGIPDRINVSTNWITFEFKDTYESDAREWVRNYLTQRGFNVSIDNIASHQGGDSEYANDWVEVDIRLENISLKTDGKTSTEETSNEKVPDINEVRLKLFEYAVDHLREPIYNVFTNFDEQEAFPEYDWHWCAYDSSSDMHIASEDALDNLIAAHVDFLIEEHPEFGTSKDKKQKLDRTMFGLRR